MSVVIFTDNVGVGRPARQPYGLPRWSPKQIHLFFTAKLFPVPFSFLKDSALVGFCLRTEARKGYWLWVPFKCRPLTDIILGLLPTVSLFNSIVVYFTVTKVTTTSFKFEWHWSKTIPSMRMSRWKQNPFWFYSMADGSIVQSSIHQNLKIFLRLL